MQLYTGSDIARGAGIFDYVMATEVERSQRLTPMRARDAIGIVAAAFASGLGTDQVGELIDNFFDAGDCELLASILNMYDGSDQRLHLWNRKAEGAERLCWNLRYYSQPKWKLTSVNKSKLAI